MESFPFPLFMGRKPDGSRPIEQAECVFHPESGRSHRAFALVRYLIQEREDLLGEVEGFLGGLLWAFEKLPEYTAEQLSKANVGVLYHQQRHGMSVLRVQPKAYGFLICRVWRDPSDGSELLETRRFSVAGGGGKPYVVTERGRSGGVATATCEGAAK